MLPKGEASFNNLYSLMKISAERRGLEWALIKDQVRTLTKGNCHYCGVAPQQKGRTADCNGTYIYNGIDRVDNSKGYMIDNVVPCCKFCNQAKSDQTIVQFQEWIGAVYQHFIDS